MLGNRRLDFFCYLDLIVSTCENSSRLEEFLVAAFERFALQNLKLSLAHSQDEIGLYGVCRFLAENQAGGPEYLRKGVFKGES